MNTGIFGGTFDPVHKAHVNLAESFIKQAALDKLHIFPNNIPPLKTGTGADNSDRAKMLELAFENIDKAVIDLFEMESNGVSYTYKTIEYMRMKYPLDTLLLLIGGDQLVQLEKWREPEFIMKNCTIYTVPRGHDIITAAEDLKKKYGAEIKILDFEPAQISSTMFRDELNKNLLSDKVYDYITEKGLYR